MLELLRRTFGALLALSGALACLGAAYYWVVFTLGTRTAPVVMQALTYLLVGVLLVGVGVRVSPRREEVPV